MGGTILLKEYSREVEQTDKLPVHDLHPVLYGLFGEVGSVMATAKKHYRESQAYTGYTVAIAEEFGDTFWYLAALCRRLQIPLDDLFRDLGHGTASALAATDLIEGAVASVRVATVSAALEASLLKLGEAAAALLSLEVSRAQALNKVRSFAKRYVEALESAELSFAGVLRANIEKVQSRFLKADPRRLPTFDLTFPKDEQIPEQFEIDIVQRANGKSYLRWNGVFLGDPLTDNIADRDGYRFHDVFHFSHAAVLHWSPVFRALIKHKRKSDPDVDETQDGGRAIVIEEGLTAWVFARAKVLNFFEDQNTLAFDLLKTLKEFVSGYEVDRCPLQLWEDAILQGYEVFRQVRKTQGGRVIADRKKRKLIYRSLQQANHAR